MGAKEAIASTFGAVFVGAVGFFLGLLLGLVVYVRNEVVGGWLVVVLPLIGAVFGAIAGTRLGAASVVGPEPQPPDVPDVAGPPPD